MVYVYNLISFNNTSASDEFLKHNFTLLLICLMTRRANNLFMGSYERAIQESSIPDL